MTILDFVLIFYLLLIDFRYFWNLCKVTEKYDKKEHQWWDPLVIIIDKKIDKGISN